MQHPTACNVTNLFGFPETCDLRPAFQPLDHMNLSPILVEPDFIHQLIDQVDAAAMVGENVLAGAGIGKLADIETGSGIAHHDEHSVRFVAGHIAFDNLSGIRVRAVYDGVRQGFGKSKLNAIFLSLGAFHFPDDVHHALDDGVDSLAVGTKRDTEFQDQLLGIEVTGLLR